MTGMRKKILPAGVTALLFIAAGAVSMSGCSLSSGNMVFNLYLDGYPAGDGVSAGVSIGHGGTGRNLSKNLALSGSNYGYALFSGVDEGTWTVSVSMQDGDTLLGATEFTVDASPGETMTTTVRGTYSGGGMTFGVTTSSTEVTTDLEIYEMDSFLTIQRNPGMSDPEESIRGAAFGNFTAAAWGEFIFPDGFAVSAGTRNLIEGAYMSVQDSYIDVVRRSELLEGNCSLEVTDINGASRAAADTITFVPGTDFIPVITSHTDGGNIIDGAIVSGDLVDYPELETVAIVVFDETTPETTVFSDVAYSPGLAFTFGPLPALAAGDYRVIVITTDIHLDITELDAIDNYEAGGLPIQTAFHAGENINVFAYHEIRVTRP
jgi:hypothetical protein